jgi:predicted acetyltransferase
MITFATKNQKQEIIRLWQTVFTADSQPFIDLYFAEKYKEENTLVCLSDKRIVSCLQLLPYTMTWYNHICKTSYISGAATLPEYRNQGIMGRLLSQSFEEMKQRDIVFTILIPQEQELIHYYQKYGYTPCFEYTTTPITLRKRLPLPSLSVSEMKAKTLAKAYHFYQQHYQQQNLVVQKCFDDFRIIWKDMKLASGWVFLCFQFEKICGICFCYPYNNELIIKDLIADSTSVRHQLVAAVIEAFPNGTISLLQPVSGNHTAVFHGMGRIVDAKQALEIYAAFYNQLDITLNITDAHIADNNGTFHLSNGNCIQQENGAYDLTMDIELLTQLLFGYQIHTLPPPYAVFPTQHPYMSLMLD